MDFFVCAISLVASIETFKFWSLTPFRYKNIAWDRNQNFNVSMLSRQEIKKTKFTIFENMKMDYI